MARMTKSEAIGHLERAKHQLRELEECSTDSQSFIKWRRDTRIAIENVFGKNSDEADEFGRVNFYPPSIGFQVVGLDDRNYAEEERSRRESFSNGLSRSESLLQSMIEQIKLYRQDEDESDTNHTDSVTSITDSRKILIVHGTNDAIKYEVARLIGKLELEEIILEEQASMGRTLIDKFEQVASEVGFAIVLLTPDDEGKKMGTKEPHSPRARQNVIFELGFVSASLGRNRVCALRKGNVEIPSDYRGVVYISMDKSNWQVSLAKELRAAGYEADANKI